MKKVLVPLQIFKDNSKFPTDAMEHVYTKKLTKYGLLPIFISAAMSKSSIDELYNMGDGLFLAGGEDWNPALYGEEKHEKTEIKEEERDMLELYLIKKALKDKKPIFGICRGMQGLAIADGGSLYQHLPDEFPKESHLDLSVDYYDLPKAKKHDVNIDKTSLIYKVLNKNKTEVNSYHHQAIKNPGNHFKIVGTSPAGVIEMIENKDSSYFCIGVQNHPEMDEDNFMEPLFEAFANSIPL